MLYRLRKTSTVLIPIFLFSSLTVLGQTDLERTAFEIASSADRRNRSRSELRTARAERVRKLPFEQSVIIYYGVPEKSSVASGPGVSMFGTDSTRRERPYSKKQQSNPAMSLANKGDALPSRRPRITIATTELQPIIISYRTRPPTAVKGAEQSLPGPNVNQAAAVASFVKKASEFDSPTKVPAQAKQSVAISNAVSSSPVHIAEKRELIDASGNVRSELPPANLNANEKLPEDPKRALTEPKVNSIPTTDPGIPASPRAIVVPNIETANSSFEKVEEKSIAESLDFIEARSAQKINIPQQNPANSSPVPDLTAIMPAAIVPSGNLSSGSLPAGTVDAIELNNSAVRLTLENQYTEARALLQRAIEADPKEAMFHRNLSVLLERMKKYDEALASARYAGTLDPANPSVVEHLCELEFSTGNTAVAVGCYEKLKSIGPLDALSQTYYGIALFRSNKEDESLKILEQAARSMPALPQAMNAVGIVYYKRKRFYDAVTAFKNAVEAAPDLFEIRYNLAVAELARGNKAAALSQYNIIKSGEPKLADRLYRMLFSDKILFADDMKNPKQ